MVNQGARVFSKFRQTRAAASGRWDADCFRFTHVKFASFQFQLRAVPLQSGGALQNRISAVQHTGLNPVPTMAQNPAMSHAPPASAGFRGGPQQAKAGSIDVDELADIIPHLHRFACSLTRNADLAADLVQDTIERALRKAHLFDGTNLRAWLTTICKRIFLNNLRRDKLRRFDVCIDDAPADSLCVPAEQEIQIYFADVAAAFKRLPDSDRLVLSLNSLAGMKYQEVADRLGIPIGTVRSRLSRARLKLAKLAGEGEERLRDLSDSSIDREFENAA